MITVEIDFELGDEVFVIQDFSILRVKIKQIDVLLYNLTDEDGDVTMVEKQRFWCNSIVNEGRSLLVDQEDIFATYPEACDELDQRLQDQ